jgi:hypothetical protein|tara:strand:+ start:1173 stop:1310 length:138 start_codon:yes stop_codon:yes gene_type:complete
MNGTIEAGILEIGTTVNFRIKPKKTTKKSVGFKKKKQRRQRLPEE